MTELTSGELAKKPEYSTAGFFTLPGCVRKVYNFNRSWRFCKGDIAGAEATDFDDSSWIIVNVPHGLELLPVSASGGINYQGPAWYRKTFSIEQTLIGNRIVLHFEAVMGKTKIWLNGTLLKVHYGGYLPIIVDISDLAEVGGENTIALMTDNSNDHDVPPGKPQEHLDFCYFGGIYRDVWMVTTGKTYITDANETEIVAGGGVFLHYEKEGVDSAAALVNVHLQNDTEENITGSVVVEYFTRDAVLGDKPVAEARVPVVMRKHESSRVEVRIELKNPHWWHVDDPYLYNVHIRLIDHKATTLDGYRLRTGVRTIEFRRNDGFYLNGEKFNDKLIGANRHQDFALIGNALPNSLHWRDAYKLRAASMRVIRCAHYPQDPAFMDACDELGLFVITATPGWQLWNWNPVFQERVVSDIRQMVRRDRNRPSTFIWEPILNETRYPPQFAKIAHDTVHEEYPFPGCYTACDDHAAGQDHFDVIYSHPFVKGFWQEFHPNTAEERKSISISYEDDRCIFTREWGDFVDNFQSDQNSPSRVVRDWGEQAQLIQATHYANPSYITTCWENLYETPGQHVGGTLWHSFDTNRGYHVDPFWGGIMDAWRLPKYSWHLFRAQSESTPFVFMANELSPISPGDIIVFSNCNEVRLSLGADILGTRATKTGTMPHSPVTFESAWSFAQWRTVSQPYILEGLDGGHVVVREDIWPAGRREAITLRADFCGIPLIADGSDMVVVVASFTDTNGRTKRLTEEQIKFTVTGKGRLVDNGRIGRNPAKTEWGEAAVLVQSAIEPGEIFITAEALTPGTNTPTPGSTAIRTVKAEHSFIGDGSATPYFDWSDLLPKERDEIWSKNRALWPDNKKKYGEIGGQQDEFA